MLPNKLLNLAEVFFGANLPGPRLQGQDFPQLFRTPSHGDRSSNLLPSNISINRPGPDFAADDNNLFNVRTFLMSES